MISRFCLAKYSSSFLLGFSSVGMVVPGLLLENICATPLPVHSIALRARRQQSRFRDWSLTCGLPGEPVRRFHQEDVARASKDAPRLATRAEIAFERQKVFTLLLPHDK